MKDRVRKDWEIKIQEGENYEDVFYSVGLPTRAPGVTKIHLVMGHKPKFVHNVIVDVMVDWGFLDGDVELPEVTYEVQEGVDSLLIYTE